MRRRALKVLAVFLAVGVIAALVGLQFSPAVLVLQDTVQPVDILVVLGGDNGERAVRAGELFGDTEAQHVLVTGAGDTEIISSMLRNEGVPADRILLEDKSASTYENAVFSAAILRSNNVHKAGIVTSWFHSRRSLACFQKAAPEIQFLSFPTKRDMPKAWPSGRYRKWVLLEYLKVAVYPFAYGVWAF